MGSEVKAKWKGFTSRLRAAIGGTKVPQGHGSTYPVQFTTFGISLGSWSREEAMLYGLASATAKARQREGLAFGLISGLYGLRECSTKARLAMGRSLACPRPISCFPCNCGSPGEPCLCKSRVGIRWYQVKEEGEGGKFDIDSWHRAADCPTSVCFSDSP